MRSPTSPPRLTTAASPGCHSMGIGLLMIVTLLWGSTFVIVKGAVAQIEPSLLTLLRFTIAALIFVPFLQWQPRYWRAGLEMGFWGILGYATQAIGLETTSVNRSAFITVLNIVLVPLFAGLAGYQVKAYTWVTVALALVGVGILSYDGSRPSIGDLWTLGTALSYAVYILRLSHHARHLSPLPLTATQLAVTPLLGLIWVGVDRPSLGSIPWGAVLYLGLAATALTTWLQTLGQQLVSATEAAVIFTLEPVWASLAAYLVLREQLGLQGWIGGMLVLLATGFSQLVAIRQVRSPEIPPG